MWCRDYLEQFFFRPTSASALGSVLNTYQSLLASLFWPSIGWEKVIRYQPSVLCEPNPEGVFLLKNKDLVIDLSIAHHRPVHSPVQRLFAEKADSFHCNGNDTRPNQVIAGPILGFLSC